MRSAALIALVVLILAGSSTAVAVAHAEPQGRAPRPTEEPAARNTDLPRPPEPGPVADLTATPTSPTSAKVTWSPPSWPGDSPVTGFDIELHRIVPVNGSDPVDVVVDAVSKPAEAQRHVFRSLRANEPDVVSVRAVSDAGPGSLVSRELLQPPPEVPASPVMRKAHRGEVGAPRTALVRWFASPDDRGSQISGYEVRIRRVDGDGHRLELLDTVVQRPEDRYLDIVLDRGRYDFVVLAVNAVGTSARSARSNAVRAR